MVYRVLDNLEENGDLEIVPRTFDKRGGNHVNFTLRNHSSIYLAYSGMDESGLGEGSLFRKIRLLRNPKLDFMFNFNILKERIISNLRR